MAKKTGLGRGLDALFSEESSPELEADQTFFRCPIHKIQPNRYQPRFQIDPYDNSFKELVASIREKGIIQPLIVTPLEDGYELIAGERRLEAAKVAGLKEVPVIVKREIGETERLEMALIENIQRQDLSPIEEAEAYYRLISEFGLTQEEVAKRVGKDRATIANILRLRKLPSTIKEDLREGRISVGHAKALLNLPLEQQLALRDEIIHKKLTVRDIEKRVQGLKRVGFKEGRSSTLEAKRMDIYAEFEERLTGALEKRVKIIPKKRGGVLQIAFSSEQELNEIVEKILG